MNVLGLGRWMSSTAAQQSAANADATESGQATPTAQQAGQLRTWGYTNMGNTCYANSVLQALYFCEPFRLAVQEGGRPPINPGAPATGPTEAGQAHPPVPVSLAPEPGTSKAAARPQSSDGKARATGTSAGRAGIANALAGHRRTSSTGSTGGMLTLGSPAGVPEAAEQQPTVPPTVNGIGTTQVSHEDDTLLSTLRDLFCAISYHSKRAGVVAPHAFINQLRKENELFRSTMHQDAHEFLGYLLNAITEELEKAEPAPLSASTSASHPSPPPSTWIHSLFQGILTNETRCLTCESITSRDEAFFDLSIDIEENTSVSSCLRQFSASEMLAQKNKFSCDTCCGLQEAERRMRLKKLPRVLALHLKRFKYQENLQRFTKLSHRVAFPSELRLFNTIDAAHPDPDQLYSLWAIVVHIGLGPHSGHYITILRSQGRWLMFDDENVSEVQEADLNKYFGDTPGAGCGYVLFYEAVSAERPNRTLVHLAHDLTPEQLALLPRERPLSPLYDPLEDEEEELLRRPGSPTESSAIATSERDLGSIPSPSLPAVVLPTPEPSPTQHLSGSTSKEGAGLRGFFGMGRKSGGGGSASVASDEGAQPLLPESPTTGRRPSLAPIVPSGSGSTSTSPDPYAPPLTPTTVDNSDAASSASSSQQQQAPISPAGGSAGKGLFGRSFLGRPKSMRRPLSTSGLSTDAPAVVDSPDAATPSPTSNPRMPFAGPSPPSTTPNLSSQTSGGTVVTKKQLRDRDDGAGKPEKKKRALFGGGGGKS